LLEPTPITDECAGSLRFLIPPTKATATTRLERSPARYDQQSRCQLWAHGTSTDPTSDGTSVQKATVLIRCQPGKGEEFLGGLKAMLLDTRAYDGCASVDAYVDADDPDTVMLIEQWESRAHMERYLAWRNESSVAERGATIFAAPPEFRYLEPKFI